MNDKSYGGKSGGNPMEEMNGGGNQGLLPRATAKFLQSVGITMGLFVQANSEFGC